MCVDDRNSNYAAGLADAFIVVEDDRFGVTSQDRPPERQLRDSRCELARVRLQPFDSLARLLERDRGLSPSTN
jgi:hypothetical protein